MPKKPINQPPNQPVVVVSFIFVILNHLWIIIIDNLDLYYP